MVAAYVLVHAACVSSGRQEGLPIPVAESILGATEAQLKSAQAKITYLGDQDKLIATVVFGSEGRSISMGQFLQVQRSGRVYTNDESPYTVRFSVTPAELGRMLAAVKPILVGSDVSRGATVLSFCVVRDTGAAVEGHEFLMGPQSVRQFYRDLIGALASENEAGRAALTRQFRSVYPE